MLLISVCVCVCVCVCVIHNIDKNFSKYAMAKCPNKCMHFTNLPLQWFIEK